MRRAVSLYKDRKQGKDGIVEYWCCRWFDENGKRRSKALGRVDDLSARDAKKRTSEIELEFDKNPTKRNTAKALTLKELTDRYMEARKNIHAHKTRLKAQEGINYLLTYFGENKRIDLITKLNAESYKAALLDGKAKTEKSRKDKLSQYSCNAQLVTAKTIFNWAVDMELLQVNPFRKTTMNIKDAKDWHYISVDEYNKIIAHAPRRLKLMIALCRLAGLRSGEAVNLGWNSIDWEKNRLTITNTDDWKPKDRDCRTIPLCPELSSMLLEAHEAAPDGQIKVIGDIYDGNLRRDFLAILSRAGLFKKTPEGKKVFFDKPIHSLRKSCITDWAGRYPMHVVKEWAGHSEISTTQQFYLKVSDSDYAKATKESFWTKPVVTENVTESQKKGENEGSEENKKAS